MPKRKKTDRSSGEEEQPSKLRATGDRDGNADKDQEVVTIYSRQPTKASQVSALPGSNAISPDLNKDLGYLRRAISLHLSRTLDEIGLNTLVVNKRRHNHLVREQMLNVEDRLAVGGFTIYNFGSQTEGTTTLEMNSDFDTLSCFNYLNVIEDMDDWKLGKINLLMLHEDTAPGYCRLQHLRGDLPLPSEDLPGEDFEHDSDGRVIVKNTFIHSLAGTMFHDRSGPAASRDGGTEFSDDDFVFALPCSTWPRQAAGFTRRIRHHDWPSQRLIEDAVSHGVFLVPVGYKLSPTEPLEWRISASLAERCLMFSLNIVHIKCYVLLKLLTKTFISPYIEQCISSYHCKTALLYCIEATEPDFWREDNLLQCITRCLEILRNWVFDLFCPQFIISEENLFAGKVTINNRDLLLSILTELIESDGRSFLHVEMDDLDLTLQTRLSTQPSRVPVIDSLDSVELVAQFEISKHKTISVFMRSYISDEEIENENQILLIRSVYRNIRTLQENVEWANKHERQALETLIPIMPCWLGSLLASFALSYSRRIPDQAIQLMSTSAKYDVASMLKLASVFYCSGKLDIVNAILKTVEDYFRRNELLIVCGCCDDHQTTVTQDFRHMLYVLRGIKARAKLFAHCVRFSPLEIHCAPSVLNHEVHRDIGNDIEHRDSYQEEWMSLAVVDCLPYMYFLQYLTYKQLGQHDLQGRSLYNLDRCVKDSNYFGHLETAWNLLGQCLENEQDPNAAMACYRASLELRPRNNAANWHVAILWYKLIKILGLLNATGITGDQVEN